MNASFIRKLYRVVFMIGDENDLISNLWETNEFQKYDLKISQYLEIPQKIQKNLLENINDGVLKVVCIEKLCDKIPSAVVWNLDWSIPIDGVSWKDREQSLLNQYIKNCEIIKSRNIKIIIVVIIENGMNCEEKSNSLKKTLDIEQKYLVVFQESTPEEIYRKKLWQTLEQITENYYQDQLENQKKKLLKVQESQSVNEIQAKIYIKMGILSEILNNIQKAEKNYINGINTINQISQMKYSQLAKITIDQKLESYPITQKLEEYRNVSSFIKFRQIFLNFACSLQKNAVSIFDQHIRLWDKKIFHKLKELSYQDYIWKQQMYEIFANFIALNNSNQIHDSRVLEMYMSCIRFNEARLQKLQYVQQDKFQVRLDKQIYIGKLEYQLDGNAISLQDYNKNDHDELIIDYRVKTENNQEEIFQKNMNILQQALKLKQLNSTQIISIQFKILHYASLLKNQQLFMSNYVDVMKFFDKNNWQKLLSDSYNMVYAIEDSIDDQKFILQQYFNAIYSINCQTSQCLRLHPVQVKQNILQIFQSLCEKNDQQITIHRELIQNHLILPEIKFSSQNIYLNQNLGVSIIIISHFELIKQVFRQIEIQFNDSQYNQITNIQDDNIVQASQLIDKKSIQKYLKIEKLRFIGQINKTNINFIVESNEIVFQSGNNILINEIKNQIQFKIWCNNYSCEKDNDQNQIFLDELVELNLDIKNTSGQSIQLLEINFYDVDISGIIEDIKSQKIPLQLKTTKLIYSNLNNQAQEFKSSEIDKISIKNFTDFTQKFNLSISQLGEMDLFIQFKFQIEGIEYNVFKKLKFNVQQPFKITHAFSDDNKTVTSQIIAQDSQTIQKISLDNEHNLNIYFFDVDHDIVMSKGDIYLQNLIIFEQSKELQLPYYNIFWKRTGKKELNIIKCDLPLITKNEQPIIVSVICEKECQYGSIIEVKTTILNKSSNHYKLQYSMEESSDFLIAGIMKKEFDLNPNQTYQLIQQLTAINIGKFSIPKFIISQSDLQFHYDSHSKQEFIMVYQ